MYHQYAELLLLFTHFGGSSVIYLIPA